MVPITMEGENRTDTIVCPDCEMQPVIVDDDEYFCDCCNEYLERSELMQPN